jgi:WD40 repeat protein
MPRLARPSPCAVLRGHAAGVTSLRFVSHHAGTTPDARHLAAGDASGVLVVWDTQVEEAVLALDPLHASPVVSVVQNPADAALYVHHKGGHLRRIDLAHNPFRPAGSDVAVASDMTLPQTQDSFCGIEFVRPHIFAGPSDTSENGHGSVAILQDCRTLGSVKTTCQFGTDSSTSSRGMLMCIEPTDGGSLLSTGYEDGSVAVWDERKPDTPVSSVKVADEVILNLASCPRGGRVVSVAFAGCGSGLAAVFDDNVVAIAANKGASATKEHGADNGIARVQWRNDGKIIATSGWDGVVRLWDGKRSASLLKPLGSLRFHDGGADAVAFANTDDGTLASGGKDCTVVLWKV